jgi:TRAP-type mannitol/chloroaromatic compound transport system permease small subunit
MSSPFSDSGQPAPSHPVAESIFRLTERCGQSIAWLLLAMVLLQVVVVVLRYGLNTGSIALQESVTYLHATAFLMGMAYTLKQDEHVRVDIIYRKLSRANQCRVNLIGFALFLLPVCGFIIWSSFHYVAQSWSIKEASADANGLAGVYLLKTLIPIFSGLLILQGFAQAMVDWKELTNKNN